MLDLVTYAPDPLKMNAKPNPATALIVIDVPTAEMIAALD